MANGDIEPRYINTKLNVADVLTKGAVRDVFDRTQKILSGEEPWPEIPSSETALRIQLADLQKRELLGMQFRVGPSWWTVMVEQSTKNLRRLDNSLEEDYSEYLSEQPSLIQRDRGMCLVMSYDSWL